MPSSWLFIFNTLQVLCSKKTDQYYTSALGNQLLGYLPAYTSSIRMLSAEELVVDLGPADNSVTQPNITTVQLEQHARCDGPSSLAHVREHAPAPAQSADHAMVGHGNVDDAGGADAAASPPHDGSVHHDDDGGAAADDDDDDGPVSFSRVRNGPKTGQSCPTVI
eukprot:jgi/Chrzof1/2076/Cz11g01290.t1